MVPGKVRGHCSIVRLAKRREGLGAESLVDHSNLPLTGCRAFVLDGIKCFQDCQSSWSYRAEGCHEGRYTRVATACQVEKAMVSKYVTRKNVMVLNKTAHRILLRLRARSLAAINSKGLRCRMRASRRRPKDKGPQEATAHARRKTRKVCFIHDSIKELHNEADQPCQQTPTPTTDYVTQARFS